VISRRTPSFFFRPVSLSPWFEMESKRGFSPFHQDLAILFFLGFAPPLSGRGIRCAVVRVPIFCSFLPVLDVAFFACRTFAFHVTFFSLVAVAFPEILKNASV